MEKSNIEEKKAISDAIRQKAKAHAEKYIERYQKVAYDSYLAGMEAMSEIMEEYENIH